MAVQLLLAANILEQKPRFAVCIAGFAAQLAEFASLPPLAVASLHVSGTQDSSVPPEHHHALASQFLDPTILEHDKGHIVSSLRRRRGGLCIRG